MKKLAKYSFGMGDRFAHQASWQLKAITEIEKQGIEVTPVWNKSNREHTTIGSKPEDNRDAAQKAIQKAGWSKPWYIDADHINLDTVDNFLESSDFFTIDVASYIGKKGDSKEEETFISKMKPLIGNLNIPGVNSPFKITEQQLRNIAGQYLHAAFMAGETYKYIESVKGKGNFITEVSMDEVPEPQTPVELFFILAMLAHYGVPAQTIAPKFTGRFNKGVDYVGDIETFRKEYEANLMVIDYAIQKFGFPPELKLSIHSGSDKFSIYPVIKELSQKHNKGFHLKTAGTTWLEEVIGLAMAGGEALLFVKNIYSRALDNIEKLCAPYADVIDINTDNLPKLSEVNNWTGEEFANALRHVPDHPMYNPDLRQLIHVAYKLAAENINQFNSFLEQHSEIVGKCVFENLYKRHAERLFVFSN
ncbi:tagaturonate epimerase family protein [Thermophagus xiamenensis]|uniref:Tagaturonate/fructuronate epimerase n=1 Tax=Thermophagus xiamenensis TaxID=385682 RepID=A0A1I2BDY5_9BACT|nr:tagaturonate epimerase family protein [Thermophagus xiamenensis]SFE54088.1 tagaturonate epimerase [Thermophagus xiamenensis]